MIHYFVSDKAHIFLDDVIDAVVVRWNSFAQEEDFRVPLDKMIELAVSKKAKKALFDSSHTLVLSEDAKWFSEEWFPKLLEAGIQYTATVNKNHPDASFETEDPEPAGKETGKLIHHEFGDVHSAVGWLSGIPA